MTKRLAPTEDQAQALQRFADTHGRTWKAQLAEHWSSARQDECGEDVTLLRQVRNALGPSWLFRSCKIAPRTTLGRRDRLPSTSSDAGPGIEAGDLDDSEAEGDLDDAGCDVEIDSSTAPAPVVLVTCPACPTGHLVEAEGGLGHTCSACPYTDLFCDGCGAKMTFAADYRATTCGGLAIVGARACVACDVYLVCRRSRPADAVDWALSPGGRSLTAGGVKIRADASRKDVGVDVEAIMARIVRVPELELEVERLRALLAGRPS